MAISYAIGLISSIVSRTFVDTMSERYFRALIFEKWIHGKRKDLVYYYNTKDSKFKKDLDNEKGKRSTDKVAEWNAIYRSALRKSTNKDEVFRRRAQGRIVRNLFFPLILFAIIISIKIFNYQCLNWFISILFAFITGCFVLYLYAYAELINMAEAHDI